MENFKGYSENPVEHKVVHFPFGIVRVAEQNRPRAFTADSICDAFFSPLRDFSHSHRLSPNRTKTRFQLTTGLEFRRVTFRSVKIVVLELESH